MNTPLGTASHAGDSGISSDPSRDVQAQQILTDRMASVGKMVAGLVHEMNNPLASAIANLELAQVDLGELARQGSSGELIEGLRQELRNARESAERVRQILQDLRVFSRPDDEERRPVDVTGVMDTSLRIAQSAIRCRAHVVKNYEQVSPVLANEASLAQVFVNIVTSMASAMQESTSAGDNEIHVGIRDELGQVVVDVSHTRQSAPPREPIPASISSNTLRPALNRGIPICQQLVTDLGGNLEVLEPADARVAVRVSLPPIESRAQPQRPVGFPAASDAPRGRVLVVVEDAMNAKAIRRALEREHDVAVADELRGALERVASGLHYDVIVCELSTHGSSGMDFYLELERLAPHQAKRMVFLTSPAAAAKTRQFLQTAPNPRVEKPFDLAQLRAAVRQQLERYPSELR